MDQNSAQRRIAARISRLREAKNLSQVELATGMGLANRQTVSEIEMGKRPVSAEELARAAKFLGVTTARLTDPFDLLGEGEYNFRSTLEGQAHLDAFQDVAGRWVAMLRVLRDHAPGTEEVFSRQLPLTQQSSFEDACASGEAVGRFLQLGTPSALELESAIQKKLGIHVLYVDAPAGISGAAIHLPDLQTILVSRQESTGRRSYDLAHELFHVLTWDRMRPERVEPIETAKKKGNRVEQLADNFAAALLMPSSEVKANWASRRDQDLARWISETASDLRVSGPALGWRLVNLGLLTKAVWLQVQPTLSASSTSEQRPRQFSAEFVRLVHAAIESGRLSVRRAAVLLQLPLVELSTLCAGYGFELPYDFS